MIFVTVGNDHHDFSRLISKIVQLVNTRKDLEFIIQHGHTKIDDSLDAKCAQFFSRVEFNSYLKKAEQVITHAGAGTLLQLTQNGIVPLVVPRLYAYGEHLNDHQMDIATEFENIGLCKVVRDVAILDDLLDTKLPFPTDDGIGRGSRLIEAIKADLDQFFYMT